MGAPAAHGSDVAGRRTQGLGQGRKVDLGIVGQRDHAAAGVEPRSGEARLGPDRHHLVGLGKALAACEGAARIDHGHPEAELLRHPTQRHRGVRRTDHEQPRRRRERPPRRPPPPRRRWPARGPPLRPHRGADGRARRSRHRARHRSSPSLAPVVQAPAAAASAQRRRAEPDAERRRTARLQRLAAALARSRLPESARSAPRCGRRSSAPPRSPARRRSRSSRAGARPDSSTRPPLSRTSFSTQPPLTEPSIRPLRVRQSRAPGRRGAEPRTRTRVARAISSPRSCHRCSSRQQFLHGRLPSTRRDWRDRRSITVRMRAPSARHSERCGSVRVCDPRRPAVSVRRALDVSPRTERAGSLSPTTTRREDSDGADAGDLLEHRRVRD